MKISKNAVVPAKIVFFFRTKPTTSHNILKLARGEPDHVLHQMLYLRDVVPVAVSFRRCSDY